MGNILGRLNLTKYHIACNIGNYKYIFNFVNNLLIKLEKNQYKDLINGDFSSLSDDEFLYLKNNNFIIDENKNLEIAKKIFYNYSNGSLYNNNNLHFSIYLTDFCNLNCDYCIIKDEHDKRNINKEICDGIIDFLFRIISKRDLKKVIIQYTGGEPFLNRKHLIYLIENIGILFKKYNIRYKNVITTNGTLDMSENVDLFNKNNVEIRITYDHGLDNRLFRLFKHNGENSSNKVIENIKKLSESGYKSKIPIVTQSIQNINNSGNIYNEIKDKIINDFKSNGIDMDKIYIPEDFIGSTTSNYCDFCIETNNNINLIKKYSYLKKLIKKILYVINGNEKNEIDKFYKSLFNPFVCCAYREGTNINIMPDGTVRGLIPGYGKDEFKVGTVYDNLDDIYEGFISVKEKAAWVKDPKCVSCPLLLRCYGGCVQGYHPKNQNPSDNCFQERRIFEYKSKIKEYIKKNQISEKEIKKVE